MKLKDLWKTHEVSKMIEIVEEIYFKGLEFLVLHMERILMENKETYFVFSQSTNCDNFSSVDNSEYQEIEKFARS